MFIVLEDITGVGILQQNTDSTLTSRHIPYISRLSFGQDRGPSDTRLPQLSASDIPFLSSQRANLPLVRKMQQERSSVHSRLFKEHAVEFHPFRPAQWRRLHIVGSLDDGHVQLVELAISSAVFEGESRMASGFRAMMRSMSGAMLEPQSSIGF